jgi:hypothetical protein
LLDHREKVAKAKGGSQRKKLDASSFPRPYYFQIEALDFSAPLKGRRTLH